MKKLPEIEYSHLPGEKHIIAYDERDNHHDFSTVQPKLGAPQKNHLTR